jgi:hypothetical protein
VKRFFIPPTVKTLFVNEALMKNLCIFWFGFVCGVIVITYDIQSAFASGVEMSGEVKVGSLRYGDNSLQLTATAQGVQGVPGVAGVKGDKGDQGDAGQPAPVLPARILYVNKLSISDFQGLWLKNCQVKTDPSCVFADFVPAFSLQFNKVSDTSILRVGWSDNVGIYSSVWCNVALFLDEEETTSCSGAWSGVASAMIFNHQNINCVLAGVAAGSHTLYVKHRSQYCVYGNYAFDSAGSNRLISVEEQN